MRNSLTSFLKEHDIALSQQQFNAMLSFTFNMGENCWGDPSQYEDPYSDDCPLATAMCNFLLKKDFSEANVYKAFGTYISKTEPYNGLSRRRIAEREMFLNGTYSKP